METFMALREKLNAHPGIAIAVVIVAVAAAIFAVLARTGEQRHLPTQVYFSVDDGASYFADDKAYLPQFTKGGKEAVEARVFQCGSGKPFVAYLTKYSPAALAALQEQKKIAAQMKDAGPRQAELFQKLSSLNGIIRSGQLYKEPGQKDWTPVEITAKCPDGVSEPQPVMP